MTVPDPFADTATILWERDPARLLDEKWLADRKLIHGHTPADRHQIRRSLQDNAKIICIDNGTFLDRPGFGSLCVLQLDSLELRFILPDR